MIENHSHIASQARDAAFWKTEVSSSIISKIKDMLGITGLKGTTLRTARTPEACEKSKELFKNFFHHEVRNVFASGIPESQTQRFEKIAEQSLNQILDATFNKMQDRLAEGKSIRDPIATMRTANAATQAFLNLLQEEKVKALHEQIALDKGNDVIKPQIMKRKDGGYNLVSSPVKIENLVLEGGGGKGIGSPTALAEMTRAGQFDSLKQVAATSVGAITAVAVAVNMSAEEILDFGELNVKKLLEGREALNAYYPELDFKSQGNSYWASAQGLVRQIDEITGRKVMDFLNEEASRNPDGYEEHWREFSRAFEEKHQLASGTVFNRLQQLRQQTFPPEPTTKSGFQTVLETGSRALETGSRALETGSRAVWETGSRAFAALQQWRHPVVPPEQQIVPPEQPTDQTESVSRADKMITFRDMQMLHELAPSKFREMHLTGFDQTNREGVYMNASSTPDMPIAYAVRISMAHPAIATAVHLTRDYGIGTNTFVDGGIASNTPVEVFFNNNLAQASREPVTVRPGQVPERTITDQDIELGTQRARTLVMTFDDQGRAYSTMHAPPSTRVASPKFYERFYGVKQEAWQADLDKQYRSNTFVVFHGKIGTTNTSPSRQEAEYAKAMSALKTLEQIHQRGNQLNLQETNTVEQAYRLLSSAEKQLLLADGPPDRADFPLDQNGRSENFEAMNELYQLALEESNPVRWHPPTATATAPGATAGEESNPVRWHPPPATATAPGATAGEESNPVRWHPPPPPGRP